MAIAPRMLAQALVALVVGVAVGLAGWGPAVAFGGHPEDPVGAWPLRPTPPVVAGFDPPSTPYGAGHRGVDLQGSAGQVVRTALAGQVSYAGSIAGRGVVVVDHGLTRTTYEPVTATVPLGAPVARGDPVGTLERGGSHCFPRTCLHWGWIHGETYLDPLRLVGLGPVRLLPLWRDAPAPVGPGPLVQQRPSGLGSRAGMSLLVGLAQAVGGDVGVELGGRE